MVGMKGFQNVYDFGTAWDRINDRNLKKEA